ncbi:hypothetical protein [Nonomuraea sp. NPDC003201]
MRRPTATQVLHAHRQQQLQERLAMGEAWTDSGFVFTQPDGNRLHPQHVSDQFLWPGYHPSGCMTSAIARPRCCWRPGWR